MLGRKTTGIVAAAGTFANAGERTGRQGDDRFGFQMLNVPTLWTAFVFNFLALGLIWAYILHSYPSLEAARYWTGSAFAAVAAALMGTAATILESLLPLVFAGPAAIFASSLLAMGVRRFYGEPV